jgi:hypothetical protein
MKNHRLFRILQIWQPDAFVYFEEDGHLYRITLQSHDLTFDEIKSFRSFIGHPLQSGKTLKSAATVVTIKRGELVGPVDAPEG